MIYIKWMYLQRHILFLSKVSQGRKQRDLRATNTPVSGDLESPGEENLDKGLLDQVGP